MKLHPEEREQLFEVMQEPGFELLHKVLEQLISDSTQSLVNLDLEATTDRRLLILNARIDGAKRLHAQLKQALNSLKPKPSKAGL